MKRVHFNPTHKGGVGKTFIASLLAQYFLETDQSFVAIDTDPGQNSFAAFKGLPVSVLDICDEEERIDERLFDKLMEYFFEGEEETDYVVDIGTANYMSIIPYLQENAVVETLRDAGIETYFHTVITGGTDLEETTIGCRRIADAFPSSPLVIWLNEYRDKIEKNGRVFEDTGLYKNYQKNIHALVRISKRNGATFGYDVSEMLKANLTFGEAIQSETFNVMARQRLKTVWRDISSQLSNIQF